MKFLLIEDSPEDQKMVIEALEAEYKDCDITTVLDGKAGFRLLGSNAFDIIICDDIQFFLKIMSNRILSKKKIVMFNPKNSSFNTSMVPNVKYVSSVWGTKALLDALKSLI